MHRRSARIGGLIVILSVVASIAPAGAGPYEWRASTRRVAIAGGSIVGGYFGAAFIQRRDYASSVGEFRVCCPPSEQGQSQTFVKPPREGDDTKYTNPEYEGCILIAHEKQELFDIGCTLLTPITVDIDPTLESAVVTFSVDSVLYPGRALTANLLMTGVGGPVLFSKAQVTTDAKTSSLTLVSPFCQGQDPVPGAVVAPCNPTATPSVVQPNAERPKRLVIDAYADLARAASLRGSIRSIHIGGGSIESGANKSAGFMLQGAGDPSQTPYFPGGSPFSGGTPLADTDLTKLVCIGPDPSNPIVCT